MTRDEALALALGLPETAAAPHFDRTAMKVTKGRIFATFGAAGDMNVKLTPDEQEMFVDSAPGVVSAIPGGWGRQGWTRVELAGADKPLVSSLLNAAWRGAAPAKLLAAHPPAT
ncbi:MAG: MmcQ/YjbR family DNA-binding protein [Phreatobacter sp.]|uniref:MmcQ/YjbR family DNA-binding protein n=1 Tax=Phreatobacter sp. TaxID=1966341 RepID=UPI001A39815C|nr:MmcQ/YjbR family DNA-binding protein [Phreatobacter sp.]MBL8569511.1 MmcQ/YjbR family DNA-binding protein [Phreatobacter sp.]